MLKRKEQGFRLALSGFNLFPFMPFLSRPGGAAARTARPETPPQTWGHLKRDTVVLFLIARDASRIAVLVTLKVTQSGHIPAARRSCVPEGFP